MGGGDGRVGKSPKGPVKTRAVGTAWHDMSQHRKVAWRLLLGGISQSSVKGVSGGSLKVV